MDEEIIALEETDEDDAPKKRKKKRVNAFMDGDEDAIDYSDDDPEDEDGYEADPALSYDEENPDDEKNEVEAYDAEINEIAPDDLGEEVELNKKMTTTLTKTRRPKRKNKSTKRNKGRNPLFSFNIP